MEISVQPHAPPALGPLPTKNMAGRVQKTVWVFWKRETLSHVGIRILDRQAPSLVIVPIGTSWGPDHFRIQMTYVYVGV
jgi:hypothetical protein